VIVSVIIVIASSDAILRITLYFTTTDVRTLASGASVSDCFCNHSYCLLRCDSAHHPLFYHNLQHIRAWLDAAGRAEQRLLCVGDGRGDTQALGKLELPNTVCCVRTRKDSRWCDLPQGAPSGRGRRRVYSDQVWTPQDKWQQRTGWQRVPLVVRGRVVRLLVRVVGPCRRVGWGKRVFFVIIVRGHHKRTKRGKSREPMAFWVHAVSDGAGGWQLPVPLAVLVLKLWQRWVVAVGFGWMKSGFGLGEKPCWGFDSGERSVERVGVWGVGVEWLLCVGWVDGWCALGRVSGSCAVDFSGCVVARAV
jgi:hypothetical protein